MKTYAALLRGINVSGQKKINMQDLKKLLANLDLHDVVTYIQSGNVVFRSKEKSEQKIISAIETAISDNYGFEVPVTIRSIKELQDCLDQNPFLKDHDEEGEERLYFTFLSAAPDEENKSKTETINYPPDQFVIKDRVVYLQCVSYGNTKLSNTFFERKLKVMATTRNLRTVKELIRLGSIK